MKHFTATRSTWRRGSVQRSLWRGLIACGGLLLLAGAAMAQPPTPTNTPTLIEEGRQLFNEETFDGNGRTCASCHPAHNNFTIDPVFIASLPADDPLFVPEHDPNLANLENMALLRGPRALVLENIDGFDKPPVFRGTPHIFDSAFSAPFGMSSQVPDLREFSLGAIRQHFPRTLNRVDGVDFRLPTEHELDALEAYQLSVLGRRNLNYDLEHLLFTDAQKRGRDLFFGEAKCSLCHNGPALGGGSFNGKSQFDLGIANLPVNLTPAPECPSCGPLGVREAGGHREFDIPPLFGIAKTAPYFHDNSRENLSRAVDFYDSTIFNASPAGVLVGGIHLSVNGNRQKINDLVAFLSALPTCGNADDFVNDRDCNIETVRCTMSTGLDDGDIVASSTSYPPPNASQRTVDASTFLVRRVRGTSYVVSDGLLRWNTGLCVPPGATVVGARLRLAFTSKENDDARDLTADWFNWGADITVGDYSPTAQTSAMSSAGTCGALCLLANISTTREEVDFPLDNVQNINPNGMTYLRLHIGGGVPVGRNSVTGIAFEAATTAKPQLIVDYVPAEGSVPTFTPVPPATFTATVPPATATATAAATSTATSVPTATNTPASTSTPTTAATATETAVPTNTLVPTFTEPPTATVPPTSTSTPADTSTPSAVPTSTNTPLPPTSTNTPVPPTSTNTPVPPTSTRTVPPTSTPTIAGALPDLVVTAVTNPPASALIGTGFSVTDTTRNQGTANAGATTTKYVLGLTPVHVNGDWLLAGQRNIPALAPGAQSTGTVTVVIQNTTAPGTYYLMACANRAPGAIAESNVGNDCTASQTQIVVTRP